MKKSALLIATGGIAIATLMASCGKDDEETKLPPIGGYNSSDEVAATNLKAHWSFEGNNNEDMSGTAPSSTTGASFATGVKGQALQLNSGYLLYPTISALSSASGFGSFSVAAWIKTANNGVGATSVFALTKSLSAQTDWNDGPINMYLENGKPLAYNDTLVLHSSFASFATGSRVGGDNINDYGERGTDFQTVLGANKWVHYVVTYDASVSAIDIYADGKLVSNNNFRIRKGPDDNLIGSLVFPTPTQCVIGGWPSLTNGFSNSTDQAWQTNYTGSIDEVRVYSKALTESEITSLMQLEQAGR